MAEEAKHKAAGRAQLQHGLLGNCVELQVRLQVEEAPDAVPVPAKAALDVRCHLKLLHLHAAAGLPEARWQRMQAGAAHLAAA